MTDDPAVLLRELTEACEDYDADKCNWEDVGVMLLKARRFLDGLET